jgi:hypothetical protein
MPRPLYAQERAAAAGLGMLREEINFLLIPAFEPRTVQLVAYMRKVQCKMEIWIILPHSE